MPDYSAWPVEADVLACLSDVGITLRSNGRVQQVLDGVIAEVSQMTKRQWIADTEDTERIYDGSGTAEQEVDEMVSLTSVVVIGFQSLPGYGLANVALVTEQNKPQTRIVVARGSLAAYTTEGVLIPIPLIFPGGRQNLTVTGRYGYATTIPSPLWNSVAEESAFLLSREALFNPAGRVAEKMEGDFRKKFALQEAVIIGWDGTYAKRVKLYTRPSGRRLRNMRNPMI